jgi:hypothetical protein
LRARPVAERLDRKTGNWMEKVSRCCSLPPIHFIHPAQSAKISVRRTRSSQMQVQTSGTV